MRKMGWGELSPCTSKHRKEPQHAKMLGKGQCGRTPYQEKLVAKALRFSQGGAGPRCGPVPWVAKHLRGAVPEVAWPMMVWSPRVFQAQHGWSYLFWKPWWVRHQRRSLESQALQRSKSRGLTQDRSMLKKRLGWWSVRCGMPGLEQAWVEKLWRCRPDKWPRPWGGSPSKGKQKVV